MAKQRKVQAIYVEFKTGEKVDIRDLPKEEYEQFLETIHAVRLAYITCGTRK